MAKIRNLKKLEGIIGSDGINHLIESARRGDDDWIIDCIPEIDTLKEGDKFWLKWFHGKIQEAGLKAGDFNIDALYHQIRRRVGLPYTGNEPWYIKKSKT